MLGMMVDIGQKLYVVPSPCPINDFKVKVMNFYVKEF